MVKMALLADEFPELHDEKNARRLIAMSEVFAERQGQPQLAHDPRLWRLVHLADRAAREANGTGE
jgi:hypothetical protein